MSESLQAALARIAQTASLATERAKTARVLLYGPSGTGKTTLAAMIARTLVDRTAGNTILYIDTSEGWVSWENMPGLSEGIVIVPFTSIDDVKAIAQGIRQKIAPWDKVKAVILDEASKMTEMDVLSVLRNRHEGMYGSALKESAEFLTSGPDYQISLQRYRELSMDLYSNRDIHVILCAHQSEKKDRRGAIISIGPEFSPKIAKTVKEPIHLSAHITGTIQNDLENPGQTKYIRNAQVHPSIMVDAKCRLNISQVSVPADTLPVLIRDWLKSGGELSEARDTQPPDTVGINETITSGIDGNLIDETVSADDGETIIDLSDITVS